MAKHGENVDLWNRVMDRAGNTMLTKRIFALMTGMANRLFNTPIPSVLHSWLSVSLTKSMRTWLDHFAVDWAISVWPGSLKNIFLAVDFIPDPSLRRQYWRSRLLPKKTNTSLGSITATSPGKFLQAQTARFGYIAQRATAHLKDLVSFPRQQFRWKRALLSARRVGLDSNC
jgi:hypothetical protein